MKAITTLLLLGGTRPLVAYADALRRQKSLRVLVLSSERHLSATLDGGLSLRDELTNRGVEWKDVAALDVRALRELTVDLDRTTAVSIAAPWIIRQDVIDLLGGRVYNLHGARLPQDRGGASTSWQIMRGNRYGFALMHRVDAGIDTGDIVEFREFLYDDCVTPLDYQRRYERELLAMLEQVTPALLRGEEPRRLAQVPYLATYWPRLNTAVHGWIDWTWSGTDIARFISAFDDPYPGAHTLLNDRPVHLRQASFDPSDGSFHPFQAGLIYRVSDVYAAICATTGSVIIRRLTDERGVNIPLESIRPGERFFTPIGKLEEARRTRVQYTPAGIRTPGT